jgi:hypothetical protein
VLQLLFSCNHFFISNFFSNFLIWGLIHFPSFKPRINISKSSSIQPEESLPSFNAENSIESAFFPFFYAMVAMELMAWPSINTWVLWCATESDAPDV